MKNAVEISVRNLSLFAGSLTIILSLSLIAMKTFWQSEVADVKVL